MELDGLLEDLQRAYRTILQLNHGTKKWSLQVPANPQEDPDIIFDRVIDWADDLALAYQTERSKNRREKEKLAFVENNAQVASQLITMLLKYINCIAPRYHPTNHHKARFTRYQSLVRTRLFQLILQYRSGEREYELYKTDEWIKDVSVAG